MRKLLSGVLLGLSCVSFQVSSQDLELGLRDSSVSVDYSTVIQSHKINTPNKLDMIMLYNEPQDMGGSVRESLLTSVGFQVKAEPDNKRDMDFSIGGRFILSSIDNERSSALALGGELSYFPSIFRQVGILTEFFYAPSILAFRNSEKYMWSSIQVDYFLMDNAGVFVGYRDVSMDKEVDDGLGGKTMTSITLDDGLFMGLKLRF
jgi:hypothetical protein